uniref:hypothetical protein n=1 Tax=uncultured Azohydromonas sp. TaxID=487342 RepID=UPI00260E13CF
PASQSCVGKTRWKSAGDNTRGEAQPGCHGCTLTVEIGAALVRLRGTVDEASVRCVLQALLELR